MSNSNSNNHTQLEKTMEPARSPPSFWTQADALCRKNLSFQKRNLRTNFCLVIFPLLLCALLLVLQIVVNNALKSSNFQCGCKCVEVNGTKGCETICGIQYSDSDQAVFCAISSPPEWPAFLQTPSFQYRAVKSVSSEYPDLPDSSCKKDRTCPVTILYTGQNRSYAYDLSARLLMNAFPLNISDPLQFFSSLTLGTDASPQSTNFLESAIMSNSSSYIIQPSCFSYGRISVPFQLDGFEFNKDFLCLEGQLSWRDNYSVINQELFEGYYRGNQAREINEFVAAYDFLNSTMNNLNIAISYNGTFGDDDGRGPTSLVRIPRSINLVSEAFLHLVSEKRVQMPLEFVKEMPKSETSQRLDLSSVLGPLFFMWVIQLLFPVILMSLVYEKEKNLRIMMKMHGLGDAPYWFITYGFFLALSVIYMICFVAFGSFIGLRFFRLNNYGIQALLFFLYLNLQLVLGFLGATAFNNVKTATVIGYIYVFGFGLLGSFLFQNFVEYKNFPRHWITIMEFLPGFSLYRGLYELAEYSRIGYLQGTKGMDWKDLNDPENGMKEVFLIMFVEWLIFLPIAYYLDQVVCIGSGIRRHPLFFLDFLSKSKKSSSRPFLNPHDSKVDVEKERSDVAHEMELVEKIIHEGSLTHAVICNGLRKVYQNPGRKSLKYAVRDLTLAVSRGECFGMLGPNGAGKTTSIGMMTGLLLPTSGTAYIDGIDIHADMDRIYTSMGVCPQHDLIWETLTGREHLLFYGRLKNIKASSLQTAVEESLKNVDLYNGGVADKLSGKYSGGMKRRLSVAISLIGNPRVVYMDEPSTGLDPASRSKLWSVVREAKKGRAIILTTHSMQEAEVLCDRIGIFVDGRLQCIGTPNELKSRYGGSYVLTITSSADDEEAVRNFVEELSGSSKKVYNQSGTQKFELSKSEVKIEDVFLMISTAKKNINIYGWGLADTTLEDVFIKVAGDAEVL